MGAAVMAIGGVISAFGQFKQAKAAQDAEKARKRQMNLEATRRKREIIREGVRARATALSNASAQGAAEGSGLQGGYGQVAGATNRALLATNQDQQLGNRVFKANAQYAKAGTLSAIGQGISSIGDTISGKTFMGYTA